MSINVGMRATRPTKIPYRKNAVGLLYVLTSGANKGKAFQSPIVFLQSGHNLYCGKHQKNLIVFNHLTVLFYGTLHKKFVNCFESKNDKQSP